MKGRESLLRGISLWGPGGPHTSSKPASASFWAAGLAIDVIGIFVSVSCIHFCHGVQDHSHSTSQRQRPSTQIGNGGSNPSSHGDQTTQRAAPLMVALALALSLCKPWRELGSTSTLSAPARMCTARACEWAEHSSRIPIGLPLPVSGNWVCCLQALLVRSG